MRGKGVREGWGVGLYGALSQSVQGVKQKKRLVAVTANLCMMIMNTSYGALYASLLICKHKLDFKFAALFLWMILVLANLSSIF